MRISCEVLDWMAFYNYKRLHSTLGYVSPVRYERRWHAAQPKKGRINRGPTTTQNRAKINRSLAQLIPHQRGAMGRLPQYLSTMHAAHNALTNH